MVCRLNGKRGLCALIIILILLFSPANIFAQEKLFVFTSIFPLQEFAKAVAGERAVVKLLIPPGTEPHTWDPKPGNIIEFSKADIFIYVGAGMEPWAEDLLQTIKNESLVTVDVSKGLDLINLHEEDGHILMHEHSSSSGADPHIWLDFSNDKRIVDKIADIFSQKDPNNKILFNQNADLYKKRLDELDKKYFTALRQCKTREILFGGHSAFAYLARRYDLMQIPVYGINPDSEPNPKDMARIIDLAKKRGIRTIFFERLVNDILARIIAKQINGSILVLNPGGNCTENEIKEGISFLDIMEMNLINLKKGLACE